MSAGADRCTLWVNHDGKAVGDTQPQKSLVRVTFKS